MQTLISMLFGQNWVYKKQDLSTYRIAHLTAPHQSHKKTLTKASNSGTDADADVDIYAGVTIQ